MAETDYAWAAGFIDGEGCFSIQLKDGYYRAMLTITQVDPRPLHKLQHIFGGVVLYIKPVAQYHYTLVGYKLNVLLANTIPYYALKGDQAELLQQFKSLPDGRTRAGRLVMAETTARKRALYTQLLHMRGYARG
jgi:hypothetical protein